MKDLANERAAVVNQLQQFNLEAVNVDGLLPTGGSSWDGLESEIRASGLFVLLLRAIERRSGDLIDTD
jgi:hypothetical protein